MSTTTRNGLALLAVAAVLLAGILALPRVGGEENAPEPAPTPVTELPVEPAPEAESTPEPSPPPEAQPEPPPPEPEPTADRPPPPAQPMQDPELLWGRTFVAMSVTERGSPRQLEPGTELEVTFAREEGGDVVRWSAGCNLHGARATVTVERVHTTEVVSTSMGCPEERHEQDRWIAQLFEADPYWLLAGDRLHLRVADTTIGFQERA